MIQFFDTVIKTFLKIRSAKRINQFYFFIGLKESLLIGVKRKRSPQGLRNYINPDLSDVSLRSIASILSNLVQFIFSIERTKFGFVKVEWLKVWFVLGLCLGVDLWILEINFGNLSEISKGWNFWTLSTGTMYGDRIDWNRGIFQILSVAYIDITLLTIKIPVTISKTDPNRPLTHFWQLIKGDEILHFLFATSFLWKLAIVTNDVSINWSRGIRGEVFFNSLLCVNRFTATLLCSAFCCVTRLHDQGTTLKHWESVIKVFNT